jgi:hypothetical protein
LLARDQTARRIEAVAGEVSRRSTFEERWAVHHLQIAGLVVDGLRYDALNRLILVTYSDPNTA